jgi:hypothetical protein
MHARRLQQIPKQTAPQGQVVDHTQRTGAWLIAAPPPNNARTHSACPFWLAINSGVAPALCLTTRHTAQHSTHRRLAWPHPLWYICAAAEDHAAPHPRKYDMGAASLTTSHHPTYPNRCAYTQAATEHHAHSPKGPSHRPYRTHRRLVDRSAPAQQRPHALHVPFPAGDEKRRGSVHLLHHTAHSNTNHTPCRLVWPHRLWHMHAAAEDHTAPHPL